MNLSHHLPTAILYLDPESAFDRFPVPKNIVKIQNFGIQCSLHQRITDFLASRFQTVKVEDATSEEVQVTSTVSKGQFADAPE